MPEVFLWRDRFGAFDRDKDGIVPFDDLSSLLKIVGHQVCEEELSSLHSKYGDKITEEVFVVIMESITSRHFEREKTIRYIRNLLSAPVHTVTRKSMETVIPLSPEEWDDLCRLQPELQSELGMRIEDFAKTIALYSS